MLALNRIYTNKCDTSLHNCFIQKLHYVELNRSIKADKYRVNILTSKTIHIYQEVAYVPIPQSSFSLLNNINGLFGIAIR